MGNAFRIDRTEVIRVAYARCGSAGRCAKVALDLSVDPDRPMTDVSWLEARASCAFSGGRLPREIEWEKAARGSDGRAFPWGATADCARANWGNFDGEGPCAAVNPGHPVAVGSYPQGASPLGVLDLAGNVWEWVDDIHDEDKDRRSVRADRAAVILWNRVRPIATPGRLTTGIPI